MVSIGCAITEPGSTRKNKTGSWRTFKPILDKDACFVREGIEKGWLPIGICRVGKNRREFYISPKKLWEVTGYVWKGRESK